MTKSRNGFAIYALPAGSGSLALSPLPGGDDRDYATDFAVLREWAPTLVISMTILDEMECAKATSLEQDLQGIGVRWIHLPVEDYGIPDPVTEALWPAASFVAQDVLQNGGRVLIHCRGGCGRSGMAALRVMTEMGENPSQALLRLRNIRPCAVETDAQLVWARSI